MRRIVPLLTAVCALLAGCGSSTIDAGKAESFLRAAMQPSPRSVHCPTGVDVKPGRSFDCAVVAADGIRYAVTLHITDSSGHVRVGPSDLHAR